MHRAEKQMHLNATAGRFCFSQNNLHFVNLYCHLTVRLGFNAFLGSLSFCCAFCNEIGALKSANMQNDFSRAACRELKAMNLSMDCAEWED